MNSTGSWFLLIASAFCWAGGGWLLVEGILRLRRREKLIVGFALGLVLQNWLANLLGQWLPVLAAFVAASLCVLLAGLLAAKPWRWPALDLRPAWGQWFLLVGMASVFTAVGRGLAFFDDFQNLPIISSMASGDIPPHFSLNPSLRFGYHYFQLLLASQWMRLGAIYPWNALDLARGFTLTLLLLLCALWAWRFTRNGAAAVFSAILVAFSGGVLWLLNILPAPLLLFLSENIKLIGSGMQTESLLSMLTQNWKLEGVGPIPIPFMFAPGINRQLIMSYDGRGPMPLMLLVLLLFFNGSWQKNKSAIVLSSILLASLSLSDEILYVLLCVGFAVTMIVWMIQNRTWRLPKSCLTWVLIFSISGFISLFQGGVFSELARNLFSPEKAGESSFFSLAFQFAWPPVVVSPHFGVLSFGNPAQAFLALLEFGPLIFAVPWVIAWYFRITRRGNWLEGALIGTIFASAMTIFVFYTGTGGITASARFMQGLWFIPKLYAVPLLWNLLKNRADALRGGAVILASVSVLGGFVLFGINFIAAAKPQPATFISLMDIQAMDNHWNKLETGVLVFDPVPSRATTIFGRPTNSSYSWYDLKPEWVAFVNHPDPYGLRAAGYNYLYFDEIYWENLAPADQQRLKADCVKILATYPGVRSEKDVRRDFRRLMDIQACH